MFGNRRTPIGWRQLVHNKTRFLVATGGVASAVILVFMQLGFMNMLIDTTITIHKKLDADIVITSPDARDMASLGSFPRRRLMQALGVPGVQDGEAFYVKATSWVKPGENEKSNITVLGVRPDYPHFVSSKLNRVLSGLNQNGTALYDAASRRAHPPLVESISSGERPIFEVASNQIEATGLFRFGASFASDGNLIVSDSTFFALLPSHQPGDVSLGTLKVAAGYDAEETVARINEVVKGDDAVARSMPAFKAHSRSRLAKDSPISYIFSFGVIVGFLVGTVIVVQILNADVQDHITEYATFRAMGFSARYLVGIVSEQAAILSIAGFIPGLMASLLAYDMMERAVSMKMTMPLSRVGLVFVATITMCAFAGAIAMRRTLKADPADVFA